MGKLRPRTQFHPDAQIVL